MFITYLQITCTFQPSQHVSVKMAAPAVDQCAHVHLGTLEHCVILLVPPAVKLVTTLITATVVGANCFHSLLYA